MADVVGAPLPDQVTDYKPTLDGKGESVIVTVYNPLSSDFRVQYSRSIVQGSQPSEAHKFAREKAGLDLSKEQNPQAHAVKYLVLKSGESINLPGDIAQIAVRQLVNYIIQVENKGKTSMPLADGFTRKQVEDRVITKVSDNLTFFNPQPQTEEQVEAEIAKLNDEPEMSETVPDPPPGTGTTYDPRATKSSGTTKQA